MDTAEGVRGGEAMVGHFGRSDIDRCREWCFMVWVIEMREGFEDTNFLQQRPRCEEGELRMTEMAYERAIAGTFGVERFCLRAVDSAGQWRLC